MMAPEFSYLAAFLVGLLGGVHCIGMCGGIVGALSMGLQQDTARAGRTLWPELLAYNGGRILSYTLAGAVMGGLGALAADMAAMHGARLWLQLLAALFMIAMGLYLGGWWFGLAQLERAGQRLWALISPLGRRLMPVRHAGQALALGLLWGWLPCGLIYSVLAWSMAAGGALEGAGLMLSFGLGTLPNLMLMGLAALKLKAWMHRVWVRRGAGLLVLGFGLYGLFAGVWAMRGAY